VSRAEDTLRIQAGRRWRLRCRRIYSIRPCQSMRLRPKHVHCFLIQLLRVSLGPYRPYRLGSCYAQTLKVEATDCLLLSNSWNSFLISLKCSLLLPLSPPISAVTITAEWYEPTNRSGISPSTISQQFRGTPFPTHSTPTNTLTSHTPSHVPGTVQGQQIAPTGVAASPNSRLGSGMTPEASERDLIVHLWQAKSRESYW
jgi:hypothetical protein